MKKLLILSTIATIVFGGAYLMADDDHKEKRHVRQYDTSKIITQIPNSPKQKLYVKECGSCHMAYQAEFLPKRSWKKMMSGLEDHFGVDATVEAEDEKMLSLYLRDNAADSKRVGKHFAKTAASVKRNAAPPISYDDPEFSETPHALT